MALKYRNARFCYKPTVGALMCRNAQHSCSEFMRKTPTLPHPLPSVSQLMALQLLVGGYLSLTSFISFRLSCVTVPLLSPSAAACQSPFSRSLSRVHAPLLRPGRAFTNTNYPPLGQRQPAGPAVDEWWTLDGGRRRVHQTQTPLGSEPTPSLSLAAVG